MSRLRRWLLMLALAAVSGTVQAASMVLSIDDGPSLQATPRLTPQQRHAALLQALQQRRVTAVLYVTLDFGANRPEGMALARAWGDAGHLLGNHTVTHADLNDDKVPLDRYLGEIATCEAAMNALPGWRRWFRATYLNEGHTPERREGLQRFLAEQRYRLAPVDLDSRDWQYAPRLATLLLDAAGDASALKAEFLQQLLARARAMRSALERNTPFVLLMHDNLLSALWLGEVLDALRAEGFVFVHPEAALPPAQGEPASLEPPPRR